MPTTTLSPHRSKRLSGRLALRAGGTILAALALVFAAHKWRQDVEVAHRSHPPSKPTLSRGKENAIRVGWEAWAKLKKADWDFGKMIEQNPGYQWKMVLPDHAASGLPGTENKNMVSFATFHPGDNHHGIALMTRIYLEENISNRRNPLRNTSEPRGEVLIWRRDGQFIRAPWHSVRLGYSPRRPGEKPELAEFYPGMDGYSPSMEVPPWIKIATNRPRAKE